MGIMEYGNIIEKEQNKFDLIFKVKRKYENTNESTTWVSINERKRVSALYKEQEYNFIPKYSEIYEIGSETFVDDVTVAAEKMAQKIYDYYYMQGNMTTGNRTTVGQVLERGYKTTWGQVLETRDKSSVKRV